MIYRVNGLDVPSLDASTTPALLVICQCRLQYTEPYVGSWVLYTEAKTLPCDSGTAFSSLYIIRISSVITYNGSCRYRGFHKWWEDSDFLCCRVESPWLFIPFFEVSYLLQRRHFKAVSTGTQVFWEKCPFLLVLAFCPHIKGVLDHWKLSVWKIPTSLKILKTRFLAFKCVQGKLFVNIFLCNISVVHLLYQ